MVREVEWDQTGEVNGCIRIEAADDPGPGGAHHQYHLWLRHGTKCLGSLYFQKGGLGEAGANGVTHEAILAVLIDRLRCFQAGSFACRENALALTNLEAALYWLNQRTLERQRRGVEGTQVK